eukprot:34758-Rhodomonas_salina.2
MKANNEDEENASSEWTRFHEQQHPQKIARTAGIAASLTEGHKTNVLVPTTDRNRTPTKNSCVTYMAWGGR